MQIRAAASEILVSRSNKQAERAITFDCPALFLADANGEFIRRQIALSL
jgi:hypothetical protein